MFNFEECYNEIVKNLKLYQERSVLFQVYDSEDEDYPETRMVKLPKDISQLQMRNLVEKVLRAYHFSEIVSFNGGPSIGSESFRKRGVVYNICNVRVLIDTSECNSIVW